jgi:predicted nucleic acid-binding protein
MATRADAYVDTSALIAFADRSDYYHPLFRRFFADPPDLLTTTLVIAEGHGWFLRRYDRRRAQQFLAMIEAMTPLRVVGVGALEQAAGIGMLQRFSDQDLTLTDAVGLHVSDAHRVSAVWSTDLHLGLTGLPLVIERGWRADVRASPLRPARTRPDETASSYSRPSTSSGCRRTQPSSASRSPSMSPACRVQIS